MTNEQKAAFINAQAISARIELESMLQANKDREAQAKAAAYGEKAFMGLQDKYLITQNSVLTVFNEWPGE